MEVELKTMKSKSTTKKEKIESAMMCWESTNNFMEEEPHKEQEKVAKKPVEKTEKQKHGEEHVRPTLDTGSQLKNFRSRNLVGREKTTDLHWRRKNPNNKK